RGRHTRFSRDWSSDVCSSDLEDQREENDEPDRLRRFRTVDAQTEDRAETAHREPEQQKQEEGDRGVTDALMRAPADRQSTPGNRSEERRVGKEWSTRGWAGAA